jgi:hypothetical protein
MPLYVAANVAIKSNWQSLIELANANNDLENDNLVENFDLHNLEKFEEIIKKNYGKTSL